MSSLITLSAVLLLAPYLWFDQLIYQKSITYGYANPIDYPPLTVYGHRSRDIIALFPGFHPSAVLGVSTESIAQEDEDAFTIAIFGDSYVWGQGVRDEDRMVTMLEKRLSQIRKTRIYSFALSGDSLFDHYAKYRKMQTFPARIDLVIFGLVENDLELNAPHKVTAYEFTELEPLARECQGDAYYDAITNEELDLLMSNLHRRDTKNYCLFQKLLPLLPKDKALYINLNWDYKDGSHSSIFDEDFPAAGFWFVSVKQLLFHNYVEVVKQDNWSQKMKVSKIDTHPSAFANELYTEMLFTEITTNPKSGFH